MSTINPVAPSTWRDGFRPEHAPDLPVAELADALVDLGRLALEFGQINRTAVYHPDGVTPESDTDHTVMLGWVACAFAARCFPTLDLGLVAQYVLADQREVA